MKIKILALSITLLIIGAIAQAGWFSNLFSKNQVDENLGGSTITVPRGGTGATSFTSGECLKGAGTGAITTGACGGSGSGSFLFSADTNYGQQVYSTSTPTLWLKSGLMASSTSHFVNASSTQLTTSGSTYLATTDGNVGIGMTGPGSLLTLGSATPLISTDTSDGADSKRLLLAGGGTSSADRGGYIGLHGNEFATRPGNIELNPGGSGNIILSSGNVGIGTTLPSSNLHIFGVRAAQKTLLILGVDNSGAAVNDEASIDFNWWNTLKTGRVSGYVQSTSGNGTGGLKFYTSSAGTTYNAAPSMTLDKDGNVGIGTTTPAVKLDVNGYVKALQTSTTTACSDNLMGSIFYNQANNKFWGCSSGSAWQQLASSGGSGTVTSVEIITPIGLTVTGTNPITSSGTFTLAYNIQQTYIPFGGVGGVIATSTGLYYNSASSLLTATNASTTALSVSNGIIQSWQTMAFQYATSSWSGTTTKFMAPAMANLTVNGVYCTTDMGTVGVSLYDGTNRANYIATASTTENFFTYATNNTFTASEPIQVDLGTPASSPLQVACRFKYTYTGY